VKNGYEAITGQINVEFKKPQLPEADWVSANLFRLHIRMMCLPASATFGKGLEACLKDIMISHIGPSHIMRMKPKRTTAMMTASWISPK